MAITFVGVSSQFAAAGSGGSPGQVTVTLPAHQADDYLLAICFSNMFPSTTLTPQFTFSTAGWTEIGADQTGNVRFRLYRKFAGAAEADPNVTVADRAGGWSAQIAAYRGVSQTPPEDITVGGSHVAGTTSFTPDTRTTVTDAALAVVVAGTDNDANGISVTTAQSFVTRMSGFAYATEEGGDHSVFLADREVATAGDVTMPTLSHGVATTWVGLTFALQPGIVGGTHITRTVKGTLAGTLVD